MDLVEENDGSDGSPVYDPRVAYKFPSSGMSPDEERMLAPEKASGEGDDGNGSGYAVEDLAW
jgi:hypothetical protein